MAQSRDLFLDACASFSDALTVEDNERIDKIRCFAKKMSVVPSSVGDFKPGLEWFNCEEPLSLGRQLRGKIVVLDFFTYCCINCLHILPHLRELEDKYTVEDGVIVIGVHSAKFDNEKDSANILAALKRYEISHPVVNDSEGELWMRLGIACWPTVLILGPKSQPIFQFTGEFKKEDLFDFVSASIDIFKSSGEISSHKLPLSSTSSLVKGPLLFPGKVIATIADDGSDLIAIANTGLHTIIIATENKIKNIVGCSGQPGFIDGTFNTSKFHAPQGLAFSSPDILFVADTENHAIRKIDLKKQCVETVVGNGLQASDTVGGGSGAGQSLSSPWDLCYIRRHVPCSSNLPQPFLCICPPAPQGYNTSDKVQPTEPLPPSIPEAPVSSHAPKAPDPPPVPKAPIPPAPFPPPPPPVPKAPIPPAPFPPPPVPKAPIPPAPFPPPPIPKAPIPPAPFPPPPPPHPVSQISKPILDLETPPILSTLSVDKDDFVEQEILFIAMAGSHQIWAFFLQDTMWWGKEFFTAGSCASVAGSGVEANRNNSYPRTSSFAQPSGLTYCPKSDELYVADSESSSIRCIQMKTGKVSAVVGGSKLPDDLFSFGDVDADRYNAKLQHPLGVAWHEKSKSLLVADSYNHKIKSVNLKTLVSSSFIGTGHAGNTCSGLKTQLNEPGGLSVSVDQSKLYIADTNNHCIKVFHFSSNSVEELDLHNPIDQQFLKEEVLQNREKLSVNFGGKIDFCLSTVIPAAYKLTEGAPQRWILKLPGSNWKASSTGGVFNPRCELKVCVKVPPAEMITVNKSTLEMSIKLFLCSGDTCLAASSKLNFLVTCDPTAPSEMVHYASFEIV